MSKRKTATDPDAPLDIDYRRHGGVRIVQGGQEVIYFGWVAPLAPVMEPIALRRLEVAQGHPALWEDAYKADGSDPDDDVFLWDYEKTVRGSMQSSWDQSSIGSCFPAGTLVRMADGSEKPIEDVQAGEYVVTHLSRPRQVKKTFKRRYSGLMVTLKAGGCPSSVTATADHRFVHYDKRFTGSKDKRRWRIANRSEEYSWTPASELKPGERVLVPVGVPCPEKDEEILDIAALVPDGKISDDGMWVSPSSYGKAIRRFIPVGPDLGRLIGLYLAEGNIHTPKKGEEAKAACVVFSFNIDESDLAEDVLRLAESLFGVVGRQTTIPAHHTRKVHIESKVFTAFIHALIPGKATTKRLPAMIHRASKETRLAALRGWMDGDGHCAIRKNSSPNAWQLILTGVSSSEGLRRDMYVLAVACGFQPRVTVRKQMAHQNAAAGHVTLYGEHAVGVMPHMHEQYEAVRKRPSRCAWKTDLGIAAPIKQASESYMEDGVVYCLEVDEDHSFIANGYGVSNCVSFGWGRGCNDLVMGAAARGEIEFVPEDVATEPIYGGSRVEIGKGVLGGSDGSLGSWAAGWVQKYGILLRKQYPPNHDLRKYSVPRCRQYGLTGCPDDLEPEAKLHPVKSVALVTSADQAWTALGLGLPIPICSNIGFDSPLSEGFCSRRGSWAHCMCVRARFTHATRGRCFVIQNSWGDYLRSTDSNATVTCKNGKRVRLPEGCFATDAATLDVILKQRDSYIPSDMHGYPERNRFRW